jgi:hypothetical protein
MLTADQLELAREVSDDVSEQAATTRLTARLDPDVAVRAGRRIRLAVDTERMHFFDPHTSLVLR